LERQDDEDGGLGRLDAPKVAAEKCKQMEQEKEAGESCKQREPE
jgi:hypothetical protein